jgi:hypothetical protein
MDLDTLSWLAPVAATFSALAVPLASEWIDRRQRDREAAQHAEMRRNHKRQVFQPLVDASPSPFRGSSAVPKQLPLDTPLRSHQAALMMCEVLLDGDCVQGGSSMALADARGRVPSTLAQLEALASKHPHQEWLVCLTEPLQSLVYQRHAPGQWNLVRTGMGLF